MRGFAVAVFMLLLSVAAVAQAPAPLPSSIYAGGVSYNTNGSPSVAGTGLYAHLVSADTGTYAFTVVDALPTSIKPFVVDTSFGAGVAQKVATLGKFPVFIPTSAGIAYNGKNTGWSWSTGAATWIKVKGDWHLMPTVRWQKSSVSNGSGYQVIGGVLIGYGK